MLDSLVPGQPGGAVQSCQLTTKAAYLGSKLSGCKHGQATVFQLGRLTGMARQGICTWPGDRPSKHIMGPDFIMKAYDDKAACKNSEST